MKTSHLTYITSFFNQLENCKSQWVIMLGEVYLKQIFCRTTGWTTWKNREWPKCACVLRSNVCWAHSDAYLGWLLSEAWVFLFCSIKLTGNELTTDECCLWWEKSWSKVLQYVWNVVDETMANNGWSFLIFWLCPFDKMKHAKYVVEWNSSEPNLKLIFLTFTAKWSHVL